MPYNACARIYSVNARLKGDFYFTLINLSARAGRRMYSVCWGLHGYHGCCWQTTPYTAEPAWL